MRETYESAASVLVLSGDLQKITASGLPVVDQMYLVTLSSRASRLWTLQEGALPEQVIVQFHNGGVNYSSLYFSILDGYHKLELGWLNMRHLFKEFIHIRGNVLRDPKSNALRHLRPSVPCQP